MQRDYSKYALLLLIATIALRFSMLFSASTAFAIAFYSCLALGIVVLWADTTLHKAYGQTIVLDSRLGLNLLAALAGVGFFAEFVRVSYSAIELMLSDGYAPLVKVVPMTACALSALLSCFYYIVISRSYSGGGYDFRLLKAFHFIPLMWIIFRILIVLTDVVNVVNDMNGVVRLIALSFALLALYSFVSELQSEQITGKASVFFFRCFGYTAVADFASSLNLFLSGGCRIYDDCFVSSVTLLLVGAFIYALSRSIYVEQKK